MVWPEGPHGPEDPLPSSPPPPGASTTEPMATNRQKTGGHLRSQDWLQDA